MKNKNGFSLVELLVVLAIMAVVGTFVGLGIGTLSNQYGKTAYRNLYNSLGSAQTVAMSKANCVFVVAVNDEGTPEFTTLHANNGVYSILDQTTASSKVTLSYHQTNGTTTQLSAGQGIVIKINRSSGAFEAFYSFTGDYANPIADSDDTIDPCDQLIVTQGNVYTIVLVPITGKFYKE